MAADADELRPDVAEQNAKSLEELHASTRDDSKSHVVEVDEAEAAESFELPGADLSNIELTIEVVPEQQDEFTCMSCFLVTHRTQLADEKKMVCRDCAG
jgi:formylmethanofuran dehydrogenase subunit E